MSCYPLYVVDGRQTLSGRDVDFRRQKYDSAQHRQNQRELKERFVIYDEHEIYTWTHKGETICEAERGMRMEQQVMYNIQLGLSMVVGLFVV